ncbi:TlpA disulfide reductase family protein [Pedobacter nyackensis]|uniref:Thiol-disulfide isomerase or thioredoxin n=1 Tax=Pedobacter nyackensis TaxID=475255 RepID=A0A1W2ES46_9SPHI|nr:TlpA disulfide reductase family protein [Pedobacter nyackensis]SMD12491.1 Thiol-disulfide isomerase or thioredoxin [Pedobacter nyackensis]
MNNRLIKLGLTFGMAGLMLASTGCSENQKDNGYHITGNINGVDSGLVKLVSYNEEDRTSTTLDSVTFKNGSFELKGTVKYPEMMTLIFTPGNWATQIFVENGTIAVKADTTGAEHYDYSSYGGEKGANLKKIEVTGSANHDIYNKYENEPEQLKFKDEFAALNKAYEAEKDLKLKEKMRSKFDSVGQLSKAWQIKWINDFITKNPTSVAGAYIFNNHYRFNSSMPLNEMDVILNKFKDEAKQSTYFRLLVSDVAKRKRVLPGEQAPDFTLLKRDSTSFALSSTKGKYVMIDFWASWCKPCREAIPHWKNVYAKYRDKGFEIVSVSNDSRWSDWFKAMDQEQMPWIQLCDEFPIKNMPAKVSTLYQIPSLPGYVLLDKEGKILVHTIEEKDIDQKLAEIFKM